MIMHWACIVIAQGSSIFIGARAQAVGYASACLDDEWSIFNNVAGLGRISHTSISFTYDALPSMSAFNRTALAITWSEKIAAALGFYRFGDDTYQEQLICIGTGRSWKNTSVGIKVNYIRYSITGIGSKNLVSVSMGGMSKLTSKMTVGAHVVNVYQPYISKVDDERMPTILVAGILFRLTDKVTVVTEVEKDFNYKPTWKWGIEYVMHKKFTARTGYNLYPQAAFFGFGFRLRKFLADYGYQFTPFVGSRHQVSIAYAVNKTGT